MFTNTNKTEGLVKYAKGVEPSCFDVSPIFMGILCHYWRCFVHAVILSEVQMPSTKFMPRDPCLTPCDFQQTCGFCGCVFRVEITWWISYSYKASQETQAYSCPECRRDSRIKTSTVPQLTLISKRTDGRTEPCPSSKTLSK